MESGNVYAKSKKKKAARISSNGLTSKDYALFIYFDKQGSLIDNH